MSDAEQREIIRTVFYFYFKMSRGNINHVLENEEIEDEPTQNLAWRILDELEALVTDEYIKGLQS